MTARECPYCERRCLLGPEGGFCGRYAATPAGVVELYPHRYAAAWVSTIESLPVFHFHPGARVLVLGGVGCNLDCAYCLNFYAARANPATSLPHHLSPERVVALARQSGCRAVVWALNEPLVSLPSLLETAAKARAAGLWVGALTNGYGTEMATRALGEALDFVNASLKLLDETLARRWLGVTSARVVRRNLELLSGLTHLEVTTPVAEEINHAELEAMASFLRSLAPHLPWHLLRLQPEHRLADWPRPRVDRLQRRLKELRKILPFTYLGNFPGSRWVSTLCPCCGTELIVRVSLGGCGARLQELRLRGNSCPRCGCPVPVIMAPGEEGGK
ncbi:radical SAM protein [Ammonifex thiophilus]|uniref:Radical SAM protein n=1 Tax=Ammonifex thiophilus TaxID=444093 RepID=A0A3D8P885_9THEO|nr:radical SAM protein [Ammonifex thiophilus]RDV84848.1 radical SAM protein [Ammonifex thiophilus]